MTDLRFPSRLDRLTPQIMTALLAEQHPRVVVTQVKVILSAHRGDGVASTADRVTLDLEYEHDVGLPSRMVLKTVLLHRGLRFGPSAIQLTGKVLDVLGSMPLGSRLRPFVFSAIGAYQRRYPHAPDAMYINEVRFYRMIRGHLAIEAPQCFGSIFDEKRRSFGVLMEDLTLRGARFPNATMDLGLDEIGGLVATLAALHARYWDNPSLTSDFRWLATPLSGGMAPVFQSLGLDLIRNQVETNDYKAALLEPLGKTVDELWERLARAQEIMATGPQTLLHGDPHIGNTYLLPEGQGGFLDWQLMIRGRWAHDFAYLLITALAPEDRRKHERDLLRSYCEGLEKGGVENPPDPNEAWLRYRQAALWGLVIGWLITPTENYGETITRANLVRLVTAVQDLETLQALA